MGTQKRRQRELAAREQLFIETAMEHIRTEGLLSLKMAHIARACDYATGTLYQHFASKEDLLLAVCASQAQQLQNITQRVHHWQASSRDKLIAFVLGDVLFALHHPDHLRLNQYIFTDAVWGAATQERCEQVITAYRPQSELAISIVEEAIAAGDIDARHQEPIELALGQWCLSMGMHTLVHAKGVLAHLEFKQPYRWLLRHIHLYLNGLQWQPLLDPFDETALTNNIKHISDALYSDLCPDALFICQDSPIEETAP